MYICVDDSRGVGKGVLLDCIPLEGFAVPYVLSLMAVCTLYDISSSSLVVPSLSCGDIIYFCKCVEGFFLYAL